MVGHPVVVGGALGPRGNRLVAHNRSCPVVAVFVTVTNHARHEHPTIATPDHHSASPNDDARPVAPGELLHPAVRFLRLDAHRPHLEAPAPSVRPTTCRPPTMHRHLGVRSRVGIVGQHVISLQDVTQHHPVDEPALHMRDWRHKTCELCGADARPLERGRWVAATSRRTQPRRCRRRRPRPSPDSWKLFTPPRWAPRSRASTFDVATGLVQLTMRSTAAKASRASRPVQSAPSRAA